MEFDFDEWARLAKNDNASFEQKRKATLQQAISEFAGNDKDALRVLNGLQFKIDMTRRKHSSPVGSCIALSSMMMDQLHRLLNVDLSAILQNSNMVTSQKPRACNIIPLKHRVIKY